MVLMLAPALAFGQSVGPRAPVEQAAEAPPAPPGLVVRGRCLAAETGEPLPGCEVFLIYNVGRASPFPWPRPYRLFRSRIGWDSLRRIRDDRRFVTAERLAALRSEGLYTRLPNAVAAADGTFVISVPSNAPELGLGDGFSGWQMEIASPGRCARRMAYWERLVVTSGRVEVGDVTLHQGARVQGRLEDQNGAPIEEALVTLDGVPMAMVEGDGVVRSMLLDGKGPVASASTMADGAFAFDTPIPPGRYALGVHEPGVGTYTPRCLKVGPAGAVARVVARRVPPLEFRLTDEAGHALGGVEVHALGAEGKVCGKTTTDRTGRAHMLPIRFLGGEPVPIAHLWVTDGSRELIDASDLSWDGTPLTLAVRTVPPLRLIVLPADGSTPERARLYVSARLNLLEADRGSPLRWSKVSSGWAANVRFPAVPHGRYALHVESLQGWGWCPLQTTLDLTRNQPREVVVHLSRAPSSVDAASER
ncbi:MAG: carboxypeptidase-like regulatory domain-containing protein [Planctomycetota bacterium]